MGVGFSKPKSLSALLSGSLSCEKSNSIKTSAFNYKPNREIKQKSFEL
jgi:hypothetical protein